jgi:hypothetical protein
VFRPYSWDGSVRGTFAEATTDLADPDQWGHGLHIFASSARGSEQYEWLAAELSGEALRRARFRVVSAVRYEYPLAADQLLHDVEPLLSRHRVELVLYGHTHVWNRFATTPGCTSRSPTWATRSAPTCRAVRPGWCRGRATVSGSSTPSTATPEGCSRSFPPSPPRTVRTARRCPTTPATR